MPDFDLERLHWHAGRPLVAGVDEAGRGCLAGPVVAAAVILPPEAHLPGLDDSKKLSADERQRLFSVVHEQALAVGVGACSPQEVDALNVLWAAMEAMRRALTDLALVPDVALIDGNRVPPEASGATVSGVLEPVVKGDARSLSIAAASVIAKVTRDRLMVALDGVLPAYGFAAHKGYPTAQHYAALADHGPTPSPPPDLPPHPLNPCSDFSLALLILAPLAASAQDEDIPSVDDRDPILYVLEDADSRVYLLGSLHVLNADAYPLPDDVEAAYADAEAVAFEIDMADMASLQSAVMSRATYADGRTLQDAMGDDFAKLEALVGPNAAQFSGFEPWAVQLTLMPLAIQSAGYDAESGIDLHFLGRAQADGKERLALETAESQMDIFDTMPEADQVAMLVETLDEWEALPDRFREMVSAWETGDEEAMAALMNDMPESVRPALLHDRNAAWVPQIEAMLAREGEDVLVVVGAGHLSGAESVIAMLREKGYTLTRQ